jgi:hypothetical protein
MVSQSLFLHISATLVNKVDGSKFLPGNVGLEEQVPDNKVRKNYTLSGRYLASGLPVKHHDRKTFIFKCR